jgi:hypothetical protein
MNKKTWNVSKLVALMAVCSFLSGCDDPQIYGSVGFSSFSGGGYHGGVGTSISIGGRIR